MVQYRNDEVKQSDIKNNRRYSLRGTTAQLY